MSDLDISRLQQQSYRRGKRDGSAQARRILNAWTEPGPRPAIHLEAQRKLRKEWPALANALDALAQKRRSYVIHVEGGSYE